ncbi:MAG: glucose-1-phosphate thymidylyltransferase RfbA [Alphaproteobacteria bacterium]
MKGIILAGGSGTRLQPITNILSKQVIPVYDKPMIYYPLSTLMSLGLKDILIISTPRDLPIIKELFKSGEQFGINIEYKVQSRPEGIAQALILAEEFLNGSPSCLILGDNIMYGSEISGENISLAFQQAIKQKTGASVVAYKVSDPQRYGVVYFNENGRAIDIIEKPQNPTSKWAVTGLYFYDGNAPKYAKALKPSPRGELEITDLNKVYLKNGNLNVIKLGKGFAWLDAGTPESLLEASVFVHAVEKRQGQKIACLEEIALNKGFITKEQFELLAKSYSKNNEYGGYLSGV